MGQVLHGSATTTEAVRRAIQRSQESVRALAQRHGISPTTVQKWRGRQTVLEGNAHFTETAFDPELKMMPSTGTIVVGCVDPRVDPVDVLGLKQGEVAVIRNVGGGVNKPIMERSRPSRRSVPSKGGPPSPCT